METKSTKMLIELSPQELLEMINKCVQTSIKHSLTQENIGDEIFSSKNAAKFIGISPPTLNIWKNEGIIPYHQIGGRVLYKKSEILSTIGSM